MESKKNKIKIRNKLKANKPKFLRLESWRYKRIKSSWRWPRGKSRMRKSKKGSPKLPSIGYGTKRELRNIHPSGLKEVIIERPEDLKNIDPKEQVIKIATGVGEKKRIVIIEKATDMNLKILNLGVFEEKQELTEESKVEIPEDKTVEKNSGIVNGDKKSKM